MLSKQWAWSDYRIALQQYREAKHERDKTLKAIATCYEAIGKGAIHGKRELGMINRIKHLNGLLYTQSVELAKYEVKINKAKGASFNV